MLRDILERHAGRVAIVAEDGELTYAELHRRADALGDALTASGVSGGDAVTIEAENTAQTVAAYVACLLNAVAMVPLDPEAPEASHAYIRSVVRPRAHIGANGKVSASGDAPEVYGTAEGGRHPGIGAIFFTSGSLAEPKGVCHTAEALLSNAAAFNALTGCGSEMRMLHALPMSYMAGFLNTLLCPLVAGGCIILAPRFSARAALSFWDTPMRHDANTFWLTPTMVSLLTRLNRGDRVSEWTRESVRHVFVGTAPLSAETAAAFRDTFGVACLPSYGLTEALLVSGFAEAPEAKPAGVGRLVPGTETELRSASGDEATEEPLAREELWLRSPYLMRAYLDPRGETHSPLDADGWFPTGDAASFADSGDQESGPLHIGDRLKNVIIKGGTNISPAQVEAAARAVQAVRDCCAVGVPHEVWGESVVLVAEVASPSDALRDEIEAACRQRLARGLWPDRVVLRTELPRTVSGKVRPASLREEL